MIDLAGLNSLSASQIDEEFGSLLKINWAEELKNST
jgi:hypothetical protein